MSEKKNSQNSSNTEQNMDGIAERNITGDDMKRYKNALDHTRSYVSGDKEWSSSSHQFSRDSSQSK